MLRTKQSVIDQIRSAFRGVALGNGVGLYQAQGIDDYDDEATCLAYREKDEKDDWERLSVADLNQCYTSPTFLDAEGLRFHLPAFLIAELEGTLNVDHVFTLTKSEVSDFSLFSTEQRAAVREYLLFVKDDLDYEFSRPAIERALAEYWK